MFFENGQIKASGKYRHGKSSGIHKKWDSKGNLLFCGRFFDGILFGKDSDGKPLEGFIETYYEDETPQFKGEFINGKLMEWFKFGQETLMTLFLYLALELGKRLPGMFIRWQTPYLENVSNRI